MPNQANKSKDKSGIVQKKRKPTVPAKEPGQEGHNAKEGNDADHQKNESSSSAKQDSKKGSGESGNE